MDQKKALTRKVIFNKDLLNYIVKEFVRGEKIANINAKQICMQGHLNLLTNQKLKLKLLFDATCMDNAAASGHLDIVKWLHENRTEGSTIHTMDFAAHCGHLHIVKWLHENSTEGCTTYAMDWAAQNGHLEVVKWLHENSTEGCTTYAMDWAAANGHLEVIKWLHEKRTEGCSENAMIGAAENGHLEIVKWLHQNRTEGCTTDLIKWFAPGPLKFARWLDEAYSGDAMNSAAAQGHLDVVKWLYENRTECKIKNALVFAQNHNQTAIVEWLKSVLPK